MMLQGDTRLGDGYKSRAQQARRISEDWIARNAYCLNCSSDQLIATRANTRTLDFTCEACAHGYELKSKSGPFTSRVVDGSYGSMIGTIQQGNTPTFLLLEYSLNWSISGLKALHHSLITEAAIKPRRPLSVSARRKGWIGCNIVLSSIALQAQIPIVIDGKVCSKEVARAAFGRLEELAPLPTPKRAWAAKILCLTDRFTGRTFSLADMYHFEFELKQTFPNNNNVKAKIRQQLQVLRDAGLIEFYGGGIYGRPNQPQDQPGG